MLFLTHFLGVQNGEICRKQVRCSGLLQAEICLHTQKQQKLPDVRSGEMEQNVFCILPNGLKLPP